MIDSRPVPVRMGEGKEGAVLGSRAHSVFGALTHMSQQCEA